MLYREVEEKIKSYDTQLEQKANEIKINIVTVGVGKNFITITDALNSITDNSFYNRYEIKIDNGLYSERIILKPYIGLVGSGRKTTIIQLDRPTTITDAEVTSDSLIECHEDGCYLKELTATGANFRYIIHIEYGVNSNRETKIINCDVIHKGNDSKYTWKYPHALGCGLGVKNTKMNFINSYLCGGNSGNGGFGLLIHDNIGTPTDVSEVIIDGCTILSTSSLVYEGLNLDNYSGNITDIPWNVSINNCKIQTGILVSGTKQRCIINGGNNAMNRYYTISWVDSQAGGVYKNSTVGTIKKGTMVLISPNGRDINAVLNGLDYTQYGRILGVAIEDIASGEFGKVVSKGEVAVLFGGVTSYLDDLTVDGNGKFIKFDSSLGDYRPILAKMTKPSSVAEDYKYVLLSDNIRSSIPQNTLLKNNMIRFGSPGGVPLVAPQYIGQFYKDTVSKGLYMATGMTVSDWERIN